MILKIGNKLKKIYNSCLSFNYQKKTIINKSGVTFIEVMVTLMVLSVGIVAVYRAYLSSLNQMDHLTARLYATTTLDNRMTIIERMLKAYRTLPFDARQPDSLRIGGKNFYYTEVTNIREIEDFNDIFEVDLSLSWTEGGREITLSRVSYVAE